MLRLFDSFDADPNGAQTAVGGWDQALVDAWLPTGGRFGGGAIRLTSASHKVRRNLATPHATGIVAAAIKFQSSLSALPQTMFRFWQGSQEQGTVRVTDSGKLALYVGPTIVATSTWALPLGLWHHIAAKHFVHASAGTIAVQVNGQAWVSFSGATLGTSTAVVSAIEIAGGTAPQIIVDDAMVADGAAGDAVSDFIGDRKVILRSVTADATPNDWTPSTGPDHYALLTDIAAVDPHTSYLRTTTTGHREQFALSALPAGITQVDGMNIVSSVRKTDAGPRQIRSVMVSSGVDADSADFAPSTTAVRRRNLFSTDPNTGLAWDVSAADAAEIAIEAV